MDPQRIPPPRVPSPIRDPESLAGPSQIKSPGEQAQQPQLSSTPPRSTSTGPFSPGSVEKHEEKDSFDTPEQLASVHHGLGIDAPLTARLAGDYQGLRRARTADTHASMGQRSGLDWIVPVEEKPTRQPTAGERLQPTLDVARSEKDKFEKKARMTGYTLNTAIGLQVLLGSLTTGLSAAAATSGKQTAVSTTILEAHSRLLLLLTSRELEVRTNLNYR